MVRFAPPAVARLMTLAFNARLQQEGVPPTAVGVTSFGNTPAFGAAPPDPFAVGYRASRRAVGETGGDRDLGAPTRKSGFWTALVRRLRGRRTRRVRTVADAPVPAEEALESLKAGNKRFAEGRSKMVKSVGADGRKVLARLGENPMASVVGNADARVQVELLFDSQPGDLFVLRTAGNAFSTADSSTIGSLEYSVSVLGVNLIVFLGHTDDGAITSAVQAALNAQQVPNSHTRLDVGLSAMVEQALAELDSAASMDETVARVVRINIFAGIERLLESSGPIRKRVESGEVRVIGAVYDLASGKVEFLGEHPRLMEIVGDPAAFAARRKRILAIMAMKRTAVMAAERRRKQNEDDDHEMERTMAKTNC